MLMYPLVQAGAPWLAACTPMQLASRTFDSLLGASRLVPVLDMLNHSEEPNAEFKGKQPVPYRIECVATNCSRNT